MFQKWYVAFVHFLVHVNLTLPCGVRIIKGTIEGGFQMPVSYKKLFDLMESHGIRKIDLRNTYKINPKTVDSLVNNRSVTVDTIMSLCEILNCQPGDIMEYIPAAEIEE